MKLIFYTLCFFPLIANSPSPYIWSLGYAMESDYPPFQTLPENYETYPPQSYHSPQNYIHNVKEGSVVWVQEYALKDFFNIVLPKIKTHFILVISDGDASFPSSYRTEFPVDSLIANPKILHIFAQNVSEFHKKISPIPIGLDFHTMSKAKGYFLEKQQSVVEQAKVLDELLNRLEPTYKRKKRALVDFHLSDRGDQFGESRSSIFQKIYPSGVIDALSEGIPRKQLWALKGKYAFSISPHGNGLDCHRTWEDLLLGCIVIVKTSSLDPLYEGLPVVIVNDWSEISEESFEQWFEQYKDAFTNPSYREKLTQAYWMNKIRNFQN
jgi:hypothetical protein